MFFKEKRGALIKRKSLKIIIRKPYCWKDISNSTEFRFKNSEQKNYITKIIIQI